ncbi:unnamed protein product [Clonostachys solani]|uniref:Uncharacterized protein n=1 Tax=Clonostachys solani TaxID=160281 RepID=A0A9P0EJU8_9HYPO|nr:unnamed protein product [Clonostachys solani]
MLFFTHTMIPFCATILLKFAAIWTPRGESLSKTLGLGFKFTEAHLNHSSSADLLSEVADQLSEKHITRLVVMGIREMPHRLPSAPGACIADEEAGSQLVRGDTKPATRPDRGARQQILRIADVLECGPDQYLRIFNGKDFLS